MKTFGFIILSLALATVSAGHLGHVIPIIADYGYAHNPAAHIPSGSVDVDVNGAVVAGPAGSVKTDNGLHGHGAGALVSGPSGEVATREGHTVLTGPGGEHNDGGVSHIVAAPVYAAAPAVVAAPVVAHAVVAPAVVPASTVLLEPAVHSVTSWGPAAVINAGWSHGGVYAAHGGFGHGLLGHHGW